VRGWARSLGVETFVGSSGRVFPVDMKAAPLVRLAFPGARLAAHERVAAVIDAPWDFPYPALLPWYGQGRDERCDLRLRTGEPFWWKDVRIESCELPGHIRRHAGYLVHWRGRRIALTGDVVQSNGEAMGLSYASCNDAAPGEDDGCIATIRRLIAWAPDLNLGGHSSGFADPLPVYRESLARMQHALPGLAALVPDGDLARAFTPPGYPD
jgi:glyoxylase-like metal-dependent hydrolase (beta-lactamase superfamily II)